MSGEYYEEWAEEQAAEVSRLRSEVVKMAAELAALRGSAMEAAIAHAVSCGVPLAELHIRVYPHDGREVLMRGEDELYEVVQTREDEPARYTVRGRSPSQSATRDGTP